MPTRNQLPVTADTITKAQIGELWTRCREEAKRNDRIRAAAGLALRAADAPSENRSAHRTRALEICAEAYNAWKNGEL